MQQAQQPLRAKRSLQTALTTFKARCRRIKVMCMKEEGEHYLATSYTHQNRLTELGIDNKHAGIEGLPVVSEEDAKIITQSILAMRGAHQKKQ